MPFTLQNIPDWTEADPDGVISLANGVLSATIGNNTPGSFYLQFPINILSMLMM